MVSPPLRRDRYVRFVRYSIVGISTFALELALFWLAVSLLSVQYLVATAVTYFLAVSANYVISRRWAFAGTTRTFSFGLFYFFKFALIGTAITTFLMWVAVSQFGAGYYAARVVIGALVGIGNFLVNLHVNFKVARVPLSLSHRE